MPMRADHVPNRRALIDRRHVADAAVRAVAEAPAGEGRAALVAVLKGALAAGRAELRRRIRETPGRGLELAHANSFLVDQLLRVAFDVTTGQLYPAANPSAGERLAMLAVGGYGRGELAPFSDVDLMFLPPLRGTPWVEQVVESLLYTLWDLGLKVGHATRSIDECIAHARNDQTIRTSLIDARFLAGDRPVFDEFAGRFREDCARQGAAAFFAAKRAERADRQRKY
ncbi:MAG: bifunctional uridylyltransferase/uridylyl-removing protein, partial [Thermaurantiacus tibetensis]